ncbi:hypothetical protein K450DRAFT_249796 [Umbelopsis ramanniana AG]|uniref:Solute carrier family 40 member n=1 Tax=Umbelopsis ramanniana AG TaxID=1314678 RepID=A0AAD5HCU4_UMBRA|nr:uncharacterized protein K450DRAFT_249796 [Umbelopsis ramanniana AG]KAI8577891.1 hypothetical protein K450DRAFT_249796 [Umbelopsis ramanniana AG]
MGDIVPNPGPTRSSISDSVREETEAHAESEIRIPYRKLYVSHFFRTWGDRLFEFGAALFIIDVFKTTLLESSLYGLLTTGIGLLFGDIMGKWVDKSPRIAVVKYLIPIQKLTIILSHVGFWALLTYFDPGIENKPMDKRAFVVFSIVVLLGGLYKVTTIGMNVALERDWIVALAAGNSSSLTSLNATLRRIDLLCKMLAPLFVALLTSTASTLVAVYFIAAWNVASLVIEYFCILTVYNSSPILSVPKPVLREANEASGYLGNSRWQDLKYCVTSPLILATLSYAMLFLTVLSMGGTMIAYMVAKQYSDPVISGIRAVCVVAGLAATFISPILTRRLGLIRGGLWSIWSQVFCLLPVVLAFYINDGAGITSTVLLFLEGAPNDRAGLISGFQYSLCNAFDMLAYATTIIWSSPDLFYIPATISFAMVAFAAIVFTVYVKQQRGHVIHAKRLFKSL